MLNILRGGLDPSKIPIDVRTRCYIHDDMLASISIENRSEKLISVVWSSILVEPFWEDAPILTGDSELDHILMSESKLLLQYKLEHDDFDMLVRVEVLERLKTSQEYFSHYWYQLVLKVGYRPISVQRTLFEEITEYYQKKFPNHSPLDIEEMAMQMVAHPDKTIPPHSTGGAVDVLLRNSSTGEVIDMGSPINMPDDTSHLIVPGLPNYALSNRNILLNGMLAGWFANLPSEWWHFSYGDAYWAVFYGYEKALYTSISEEE